MDSLAIKTAVLSITSPALQSSAAQLARSCNKHAAAVRDAQPDRFGFFATLLCLCADADLALAEMAYSLGHLGADGVTLYTRYGPDGHHLGHPSFRAVWVELNKRHAVVSVHPSDSADIDLVHAGGTLPMLADRAFTLMTDCGLTEKTLEECWEDCRTFYYDTALSQNEYTLPLITKLAAPGHVLYGSDFLYAPNTTITTMTKRLDGYEFKGGEKERAAVDYGSAMELFPRLKAYR